MLLYHGAYMWRTTIASADTTSGGNGDHIIEGEAVWNLLLASPLDPPVQVVPPKTQTPDGSRDIELIWTEGPLYVKANDTLLFSDVPGNRMYAWNRSSSPPSLEIVADPSGDNDPAEDWRAEPGSNGLALIPSGDDDNDDGSLLAVCQHGARRLAQFDPRTGERTPLATHWNDRRLNGPNDVVVVKENGRRYAYFTDPVYAWLEKDRFDDLPYLDEYVRDDGPGSCAVYRVEIPSSPMEEMPVVEKLVEMDRPNGIQFKGDSLIVADCCQGTHLETCQGGTSRWTVFERNHTNIMVMDEIFPSSWKPTKVIEQKTPLDEFEPSCADGFKVDADHTGLLFASCTNGLCVVDVDKGEVVGRLKNLGWRLSNTVIVGDTLYMTGNQGVWKLDLNPDRKQLYLSFKDEDKESSSAVVFGPFQIFYSGCLLVVVTLLFS